MGLNSSIFSTTVAGLAFSRVYFLIFCCLKIWLFLSSNLDLNWPWVCWGRLKAGMDTYGTFSSSSTWADFLTDGAKELAAEGLTEESIDGGMESCTSSASEFIPEFFFFLVIILSLDYDYLSGVCPLEIGRGFVKFYYSLKLVFPPTSPWPWRCYSSWTNIWLFGLRGICLVIYCFA